MQIDESCKLLNFWRKELNLWLGYKDIVIRKSEFVAKTHFLSSDPPFIYLWTHSFYSLWPYINLRFCYSLKFDSLQKRFFFLSYMNIWLRHVLFTSVLFKPFPSYNNCVQRSNIRNCQPKKRTNFVNCNYIWVTIWVNLVLSFSYYHPQRIIL